MKHFSGSPMFIGGGVNHC